MTNLVRRCIVITLGLLGAVFAWPLIEACIHLQGRFPGYFLYTLVSGVLTGAAMGAFFASAEGLLAASAAKALKGAFNGALSGLAGGVAGAFAAQALLFLAGDHLAQDAGTGSGLGLMLARAAGWAVIGAFIGMSEGLRARSAKKMLFGLVGGLTGGFLGGLLFVWTSTTHPGFPAGRLGALLLTGGLIALLYSLLEKRFAQGTIKVLNGALRGKEFLINQRKISLGSGGGDDIVLAGYRGLAAGHAAIRVTRDAITILPQGGKVLVNEMPVTMAELELDDVIQLGEVKILYGYFG